ncbi:AAA family ATPase [Glycomyces tenuis]|uniref:AAA family ATPase n=1 Tax=Glycomyces tenuis TaxID=58116 RepID=UPI0004295B4A|nr:AAA family ATPase [Glycomyces tenuis]
MVSNRSIVINGDLGSGKSTASVEIARRLGLRRVSIGDLYRKIAEERGMTALQLNVHAELDEEIDRYVDQLQADIADSGEQLVVDSRLAWHFFKDAFKVHLITEPSVSARRVLGRPADDVEGYSSLQEAMARLKQRSDSERGRFLSRYGVDKCRLRNYDIVCDSTRATPEQIVEEVTRAYRSAQEHPSGHRPGPMLLLDPNRIYPTKAIGDSEVEADRDGPLKVAYDETVFYAVEGHARLSAAIRDGLALVPATLHAEGHETVADGLDAMEYLSVTAGPQVVDAWNEAHGVHLPPLEHLKDMSDQM